MNIKMLEDTRGSDDPVGRYVKTYQKDVIYEMNSDWEVDLAQAFISTKRAVEVKGKASKPPLPGTEPDQNATKMDRINPDDYTWKDLQDYIERLTGAKPKSKAVARDALRNRGMLKE